MLDLRLERAGSLLQHADLAQPCFLVALEISLGWQHGRVLPTDATERVAVRGLVEAAHRVCAQERESVDLLQLVPQLLEMNRAVDVTVLPKHVDHLAVRAYHCGSG